MAATTTRSDASTAARPKSDGPAQTTPRSAATPTPEDLMTSFSCFK